MFDLHIVPESTTTAKDIGLTLSQAGVTFRLSSDRLLNAVNDIKASVYLNVIVIQRHFKWIFGMFLVSPEDFRNS
jgi:hypothetical protein